MTHLIKLNFITKGIDAANLPSTFRSKSVIETVRTTLTRKNHQFPVRFSIFHQHFQAFIITSLTTVHLSVNVTHQAIYINHIAM